MGFDREKAFENNDGLLFEDGAHITSGTAAPSVSTHDNPENGDWYLQKLAVPVLWIYENGAWVAKSFGGGGGPTIRNVPQNAHNFTLPTFGFLPLNYDNVSGRYRAARADTPEEACDVIAVGFPDNNTITLQEGGFLEVPGHGLDIGKWYVLRSGLAGLIQPWDGLSGNDVPVQYLCFIADGNTLVLRPDPIAIQDLVPPDPISIVDEWAQTTTANISAGSNRLALIAIIWEEQGGGSTNVTSVTLGGQTATIIAQQPILSGIQFGCALAYVTEAQLALVAGSAIAVNWSAGTPTFLAVSQATVENVDQVTPIVDTNTDSGTGGTDTMIASVNTLDRGYGFFVCGGGNNGMGFTNNGAGWNRKINFAIASSDGVVDDKLVTADATPDLVDIDITGSNRHAMVATSLRPL